MKHCIFTFRFQSGLRVFILSSIVLASAIAVSANEFAGLPEVRALTKGKPRDVQNFISRVAECHHWGGEEPYDEARKKEIMDAVKKAGCDEIDADKNKLLKKYKKRKSIVSAIKKSENL
jgi:hypothetical protein